MLFLFVDVSRNTIFCSTSYLFLSSFLERDPEEGWGFWIRLWNASSLDIALSRFHWLKLECHLHIFFLKHVWNMEVASTICLLQVPLWSLTRPPFIITRLCLIWLKGHQESHNKVRLPNSTYCLSYIWTRNLSIIDIMLFYEAISNL